MSAPNPLSWPSLSEVAISKGTANVSASDLKKLSPLMKHYGKMAHPFTQCVRDNAKRWGEDLAKKRCAVLKDLIRGTTKWRNREEEMAATVALLEAQDFLAGVAEVVGDGTLAELALAESAPDAATHQLWEEVSNAAALVEFLPATLQEASVWVPPYKRLGKNVSGYYRDLTARINAIKEGGALEIPGSVTIHRPRKGPDGGLVLRGEVKIAKPKFVVKTPKEAHEYSKAELAAQKALHASARSKDPNSPGGAVPSADLKHAVLGDSRTGAVPFQIGMPGGGQQIHMTPTGNPDPTQHHDYVDYSVLDKGPVKEPQSLKNERARLTTIDTELLKLRAPGKDPGERGKRLTAERQQVIENIKRMRAAAKAKRDQAPPK